MRELIARTRLAGLHIVAVDSTVLATPDRPTRDGVFGPTGGSATSARSTQTPWPEAQPGRPARANTFASDRSLVIPVIASLGEIRRARELRQQIEKRYLNRPNQPYCLWCVGAD